MSNCRNEHRIAAPPGAPNDVRTIPTATILERTYYSHSLGRTQPYLCLLPEPVENSERKLGLLILLHGLAGGYQDWNRYSRIARYLARADVAVVCPDGVSGWFTNAVSGGERSEDDIIQDLLPHLDSTLPLLPPPARAIAGLSMGGYGAVKLALKYPQLFRLASSHSGALGMPSRTGTHPVFGDAHADSQFRRKEDLFWLAEQALCRPPLERPDLILDCGLSDPLIDESRAFSNHLNYIGYGHIYREMPGHHSWPYWDRAFRTALPVIMEHVGVNDRPAMDISQTEI